MLTGSAEDEDAAIKLRDKFRRQVAEATAARTSVTLGYLWARILDGGCDLRFSGAWLVMLRSDTRW
jgi:hypothetical protein